MKKSLLPCLFILLVVVNSAYGSALYSTQDLILISKLYVNINGEDINLKEKILTEYSRNYSERIMFPGKATFTPIDGLSSKVLNYYRTIINNADVEVGILRKDGWTFLAFIVSPNIAKKKRAIGLSDMLDIDITRVLPEGVPVGSEGKMTYFLIQTLPPEDQSIEDGMTPLETMISRAEAGLIQMPADGEWNTSQIEDLPFIIGEGSRKVRMWCKAGIVIGTTGGSALAGMALGTAGSPIGTVVGGIIGGGSAFLATLSTVVLQNIQDDQSDEGLRLPPSPLPPSGPALNIEIEIEIEQRELYFIIEKLERSSFTIDSENFIYRQPAETITIERPEFDLLETPKAVSPTLQPITNFSYHEDPLPEEERDGKPNYNQR